MRSKNQPIMVQENRGVDEHSEKDPTVETSSGSDKTVDSKCRNLDDVLQRMIIAKNRSSSDKDLKTLDNKTVKSGKSNNSQIGDQNSTDPNRSSDAASKMIDVQFSSGNKNPISGVKFGEVESLDNFEHKNGVRIDALVHDNNNSKHKDVSFDSMADNQPVIKPFISSAVLDRQNSDNFQRKLSSDDEGRLSTGVKVDPGGVLRTNGDQYSTESRFQSNKSPHGGSSSSSSSGREEREASRSPPELIPSHDISGSSPRQTQSFSYSPPSQHLPLYSHLSNPQTVGSFVSLAASVPSMLLSGTHKPTFASTITTDSDKPSLSPENGALFRSYQQSYFDRINGGRDEFPNNTTVTASSVPVPVPRNESPRNGSKSNSPKSGRGENGKRGEGNNRAGGDKPQYKRPPHTYPALIASAILDSPGNLITLRGIYDYIMNNFPYYKYCHDKSAWQNSIRHNLSLNQCFVKVPRYENAAKSNFWTMTRDGFEEFGNENSFKRRRRRGAALAPISAYKNKKYGAAASEGENADTKHKQKQFQQESNGHDISGILGWSQNASDAANFMKKSPSSDDLKRPMSSPQDIDSLPPKHPRMMVLKQGDGPKIGNKNKRGDRVHRPSSLSSVEEMQGNVNSFSKTLSEGSKPDPSKIPAQFMGEDFSHYDARAAQQHWIMAAAAAQKNLIAGLTTNGVFPPYLLPSNGSPSNSPPIHRENSPPGYPQINAHRDSSNDKRDLIQNGLHKSPVMLENIEIGTQSPNGGYNSEKEKVSSFQCRFCNYKYVGESSISLDQHCQIMHQQELARAKVSSFTENHRDSLATHADKRESHNLLRGLNWPPSHSAAFTSTGFNPAVPTSVQNMGGLYNEPLMRSLAMQLGSSMGDKNPPSSSPTSTGDISTMQRQQMLALNSIFQQAALSGSQSQDQSMRQLLYQQLLLQNPLFASNPAFASTFASQGVAASSEHVSPITKLLNYQRMLENSSEIPKEDPRQLALQSQLSALRNQVEQSNTGFTKPESPANNDESADNDKKSIDEEYKNIHSWKKCAYCDFTAKGSHGLELHYRKTHSSGGKYMSEETSEQNQRKSPDATPNATNTKESETAYENLAETSKLSPKEVHERNGHVTAECSTQTESDQSHERTCNYCDVTFGDDMMHALHMSCHDKSSPFKCTICGQSCHEKYYFNVHLLRGLHNPISGHEPDSNSARRTSRISSDTPSSDEYEGRVRRQSSSNRNQGYPNNVDDVICQQ